MEAFPINPTLQVVNKPTSNPKASRASSIQKDLKHPFYMDLTKAFIDEILVFTEQKQLIYASDGAHKILSRLQRDNLSESNIPDEIWHICQHLVQCRHCFPHQNWLIEFDIFTQDSTILHIRSRWLKPEDLDYPCLFLVIEDRQQAITNIVIEEAKDYGLTPREKEVWMLHRNDLTYKKIAKELGITPNTVKKHMRSIHAKKKISDRSSMMDL